MSSRVTPARAKYPGRPVAAVNNGGLNAAFASPAIKNDIDKAGQAVKIT